MCFFVGDICSELAFQIHADKRTYLTFKELLICY